MGNTGNQPIEVVEAEYPVTVLEYSIAPDKGGAGEFRGGAPVKRVTRLNGDAQITLIAERGRVESGVTESDFIFAAKVERLSSSRAVAAVPRYTASG